MAKVYITEFESAPRDAKGITAGSAQMPPIATQTVAIGAGSVQSNAFNAATKYIRISADAVCSMEFGANPTATANSDRLPANWIEVLGVTPGHKVAIITNT